MRGVSKYNYVVAPIVLIAISLLIPLGVGLHVEAQQVPREDTVYVIGAQWGPPPSWNLYSPQTTWERVSSYTYLCLSTAGSSTHGSH